MATQIIIADQGKVEVTRWHVGDDFRVRFFTAGGSSVYWCTNGAGINAFMDALLQRHAYSHVAHRTFMQLMWDNGGVAIVSGDPELYPRSYHMTRLNNGQILEVCQAIEKVIGTDYSQ